MCKGRHTRQNDDESFPFDGLRVLIIPEPRAGGSAFEAAMLVAKYLKDRGCRIRIAGAENEQDRQSASSHGFSLYEFPWNSSVLKPDPPSRGYFQRARDLLAVMDDLALEVQRLLEKEPVDLALVAAPAGIIEFAAYQALSKLKIPTMSLIANYASRMNYRYPPVFSKLRAKSQGASAWGWRERIRCRLHWRRTAAPGSWNLSNLVFHRPKTRLARQRGWSFVPFEWGIRPDLPELVVCHRALDWPEVRASSEHRFYFVPPHRPASSEQPAWLNELGVGKPLVYCNTSSGFSSEQIWQGRFGQDSKYKRHIEILIETFARRPEWHLILSCGGAEDLVSWFPPTSTPANVHVMLWVPSQAEAIRHSTFVITPGGAATLRECVSEGVPMLVLPFWSDHPGNAMRVECAGVGLNGGHFGSLTADRVEALVEAMLNRSQIPAAASRMAVSAGQEADSERERWTEFLKDYVSEESETSPKYGTQRQPARAR